MRNGTRLRMGRAPGRGKVVRLLYLESNLPVITGELHGLDGDVEISLAQVTRLTADVLFGGYSQ